MEVNRRSLPFVRQAHLTDYSLPAGHPMSFEVDEIIPVSRYKEGGYASAQACALDFENTQPVHRLLSLQSEEG